VTKKELDLAKVVVASLEGDFDPSEYVDEYQVQLRELIEAKLERGDAVASERPEAEGEEGGGEVLDLMEALRRSVAKKRGSGDDGEKKPAGGRKKASASSAEKPARKRKTS